MAQSKNEDVVKNAFYVANESPYRIKVETTKHTQNLPSTSTDQSMAKCNDSDTRVVGSAFECIPINHGEVRKFTVSWIQLSDSKNEVFYRDHANPQTVLIVSYIPTVGCYSSECYSVRVSEKLPADIESGRWKAEHATENASAGNRMPVNYIYVANAYHDKIAIECRNEAKNDAPAKVIPLASAECSAAIQEKFIGIKTWSSVNPVYIYVGSTDSYAGRALIVTADAALQQSRVLNDDSYSRGGIWIADADSRNHYPKEFYVANATEFRIRVKATVFSPKLPDSAPDGHSDDYITVMNGEYLKFKGCHAHIFGPNDVRIFCNEVQANTSVIVQKGIAGGFEISGDVPKDDVSNSVWKPRSKFWSWFGYK